MLLVLVLCIGWYVMAADLSPLNISISLSLIEYYILRSHL